MAEDLLREFVSLTLELRIREAEVSDGSKVGWGDWRHILDLEKRINDLTFWRDRSPKGSDTRANYSRIVHKLKAELKSARAKQSKRTGPKK